jgi:hypothetical protein
MKYLVLLLAGALCTTPCGATMLEDEVRVSESLSRRLQAALDQRYGEGRARAVARLRLRLTPEARGLVARLMAPPRQQEKKEKIAEEDPAFRWSWLGGEPAPGSVDKRFVLPGIPDGKKEDAKDAAAPADPQAPPLGALAQILAAYGTEIESLNVRVTLDPGVPNEANDAVIVLAQEVTGAAHDQVVVERAALPGAVERVLADPRALAALAGPAGWVAGALAAAMLLALALWLLARALRHGADRLASALQAAGQRTKQVEISRDDSPPPASPQIEAPPEPKADEPAPPSGEFAPDALLIRVGAANVERLSHLLKEQSPENIALIMPYLESDVRELYLARLAPDLAQRMLLAMCPMRYVDPELIKKLKDEMERRIHGVVGGAEHVVQVLRSSGEARRESMLQALTDLDPKIAAEVRRRMMAFSDIPRLSPDELALLTEAAEVSDLAAAAADGPDELRLAFSGALTKSARRVFDEGIALLKENPDPARVAASRGLVLRAAERLLREGRIRSPERDAALGFETKTNTATP